MDLLEQRALLTQVNLNPYVNSNIQKYTHGTDYPLGGTSLTVGGIGFTLATLTGGGTGVIQTTTQTNATPFDVPVSVAHPSTVYALINSTYGVYGDTVGSVEFKATGGLDVSVNLVEGGDIRDHNNYEFNNTIGRGSLGIDYLGTASFGGGQVRLDKIGFTLPASFQTATLTDIILHGSGNDPDGEPFLAAATVTTGPSVALPTLTALRASTATASQGQAVTFTATVDDLSPGGDLPNGGTVTFFDQGGTIGSGTLVDGVAAFTTSSLAAGTVKVSASYGGTVAFAPSATGTIVTIAGNGTAGDAGNNGIATAAELNHPWGLTYDLAGDVFFVDVINSRIHEVVKATGDIISVAGNGTAGYSGDNGLATSAEMNVPNGLVIDSAGDLFVADQVNNRIREVVKATGKIITVAGNGIAGFTGDNGPATAAEISSPRGLAIDSAGDLFIADILNNRIREVVKATGKIITVAGNGTTAYSGDGGLATAAGLYNPTFAAVDPSGNLFITSNNVIREVVKATGKIITVAGTGIAGFTGDNGLATAAELNGDTGIAVDLMGDLFIADSANNRIREVVKATGDIISVAGNGTIGYTGNSGPATAAELNDPGRVAVDPSGDLYLSDSMNNVVRQITPAVTVTIRPSNVLPTLTSLKMSTTGSMATFTATVSDLSAGGPTPNGGTVTFLDQGAAIGGATLVNGVAAYTTSGLGATPGTITASYGGTANFAASATGMIVTSAGNGTAGDTGDNGPASAAELDQPVGMAFDLAGDLFIADSANNVVREVVKATGEIITVAGDGNAGYSGDGGPATAAELNGPDGVALDAAGDLFLSETIDNVVREVVKATGNILTLAGDGTAGSSGDNGLATSAELHDPRGLAIDSAGDLFIADADNAEIREVVKATGDILTVAGNGTAGSGGDNGPATLAELNDPFDVVLDPAGDLFIADSANNRIREVVKATGDILTVAGNGTAGSGGDDGQATLAELHLPSGITLDQAGDLFIVDQANNALREVVKATGDFFTIAGDGTVGYSGDGGTATAAEFDDPGRLAIDAAGDLFLSDSGNNVVREVTPAVNLTVSPAPTINWPDPAPIVYGTALGSTQLDATASFDGSNVAGTFTYSPGAGTILGAGARTLSVTFTPTDSTDFQAVSATAAITVQKATPIVSWAGPAAIISGTALGTNQLDATASVPGTFAYNPAAGTLLKAGLAQALSVTFTPTDSTDDSVVTASQTINVLIPTSISVSIPSGSSAWQQPVTLTATISTPAGFAPPVGSITFFDGTTPIGPATLNGSGKASLVVTTLGRGSHSITANYAGSSTDAASTSTAATLYLGKRPLGDFDGDGKSDIAIYDQTAATFYIINTGGGSRTQLYGNAAHVNIPISGDFDGDGKTDIAIYDQTAAEFYVLESGGGTIAQPFGTVGHVNIPIAGDFNGDGKTDIAIYDQTAAELYVVESGGGSIALPFGNASHVNVPMAGDFDGDGKTDIAIFDQTAAEFYVIKSGGGSIAQPFGNHSHVNIPVAGDFDGDGKTDIAIYDQTAAISYVLYSGGGGLAQAFGPGTAINVPFAGDFDGDGKTDQAIYDTTDGDLFVLESGGGSIAVPFGNKKHANIPI